MSSDEPTDCRAALAASRNESEDRLTALKHLAVDLDNLRRRTAREVDEARRFAIEPLLESLLPVRDGLERGLQAAGEAPADDGLRAGVQLVLREFDRVLDEYGVGVIDPHSEPFDPELHEAVSAEECSELPPDTVCRVYEKGYRLPGRLIRPARVAVSKSP